MIARLDLPSGPPNAVIAEGRNREKTPNAIVAKEGRPNLLISGRPRFGSVRLRFGVGTVRAVPVFGSGGSSVRRDFRCFSTV